MGEEKRFILFLLVTMAIVLVTPPIFQSIFGPPPQAVPPAPQPGGDDPAAAPVQLEHAQPKEPAAAAEPARTEPPEPAAPAATEPVVDEPPPPRESVVLGSSDPSTGYKMRVQISNLGATVEEIELGDFENEARTGPLKLISTSGDDLGSFTTDLKGLPVNLAERPWKLVAAPAEDESQQAVSVRFQTSIAAHNLVMTKTYTLRKQSYVLELAVELENRATSDIEIVHRLGGPRGFVLEGAWYATKKREVAIAHGPGVNLRRDTVTAAELVKGADAIRELAGASGTIRRDQWTHPPSAFDRFDVDGNGRLVAEEIERAAHQMSSKKRWMEQPLRFAGVDGQFFCVLMLFPRSDTTDARWDAATVPILVSHDRRNPDRSDVGVEVESKSIELPAGKSVAYSIPIYAGPRNPDVLSQSIADQAIVRNIINYQGALLIFPASMVSATANVMLFVLHQFHKVVPNWGVAIIMLTVLVRLLMFPLSRKQAMAAVKMQALKPELDALRDKYKSDKQKLSQAQMELWRKHGVNPLGGCLPLVIQMPIFIGLWQGLQSSVDLRLARFLWIDNLAAPDGPSIPIFEWGENIPLVSWLLGPYFNLLPCILIALMLVQQKMFMPPKSDPPDPQMEMQQKMMTYMMVFFGCIFWRLPSGLCVYYIASTLWGIAERKLLPKIQHAEPAEAAAVPEKKTADAGDRKGRGSTRDGKPAGRDARDKRTANQSGWSLAAWISDLLKRADKR